MKPAVIFLPVAALPCCIIWASSEHRILLVHIPFLNCKSLFARLHLHTYSNSFLKKVMALLAAHSLLHFLAHVDVRVLYSTSIYYLCGVYVVHKVFKGRHCVHVCIIHERVHIPSFLSGNYRHTITVYIYITYYRQRVYMVYLYIHPMYVYILIQHCYLVLLALYSTDELQVGDRCLTILSSQWKSEVFFVLHVEFCRNSIQVAVENKTKKSVLEAVHPKSCNAVPLVFLIM